MEKGTIQVYYGAGQGKTSAALGHALRKASEGKNAIIIQFLKCQINNDYLQKLEPEVKVFRFERTAVGFDELTEEQKQDEKINIMNGINYARKVLNTAECDLLVLDEILGLIDLGLVSEQEIIDVLKNKSLSTNIIMTGYNISPGIFEIADSVLNVKPEK